MENNVDISKDEIWQIDQGIDNDEINSYQVTNFNFNKQMIRKWYFHITFYDIFDNFMNHNAVI